MGGGGKTGEKVWGASGGRVEKRQQQQLERSREWQNAAEGKDRGRTGERNRTKTGILTLQEPE